MHSYPVTAGEISRAKFYLKPLQKPVSGKKYSWTIVRNMLKWSEILQREGFCFNSWKFSVFSKFTTFFLPSLKKFFVLKEPTCESLWSPFVYWMSLFQCMTSPGKEKPTERENCIQNSSGVLIEFYRGQNGYLQKDHGLAWGIERRYLPRTNAAPVHLLGDTVKNI